MVDYSNIRDIDSLRSARKRLSSEIRSKETELADDYRNLKSFINPMTYVHKLITRAYALRHIFTAVQNGFDSVKSFVESMAGKFRKNDSEKESVAETEVPPRGGADAEQKLHDEASSETGARVV